MRLIDRILNLFERRKMKNEPWLSYYSREDRSIKFTKKSIYEYMKDSVGDDKGFVALNYFNHKITYREMFNNIDIVARGLREFGVKEKDIVTMCLPNMPEAIYIFYACNKIGATIDIIHPLSSSEQLKSYLNNSKSRFLFLVDFDYEKYCDVIEESLVYKTILVSPKESMPSYLYIGYSLTRGLKIKKPRRYKHEYLRWNEFLFYGTTHKNDFSAKVKKDDLAIILHSGGTTGTPKGIMISNYSFNAIAMQGAVNVIDVRPKDRIVTLLSWIWIRYMCTYTALFKS